MADYVIDNRPSLLSGYPPLITVEQICGLTGQSAQTVRSLLRDGKIPGCKIGRRYYVPRDEFERFIRGGVEAR